MEAFFSKISEHRQLQAMTLESTMAAHILNRCFSFSLQISQYLLYMLYLWFCHRQAFCGSKLECTELRMNLIYFSTRVLCVL